MNKLTKILFLAVICASIITSGFALANIGNKTGDSFDQNNYDSFVQMRMTEDERAQNKELRQENHEAIHAKQEETKEKFFQILNVFTPNLVDDFELAFSIADSLNSQISNLRKANKPSGDVNEAMKDIYDDLCEKARNGNLTREEAIVEFESIRHKKSEDNEEILSNEELEAIKAEKEAKRKAFQNAIKENNEDVIVERLEDVLSNIQERNIKMAEKLTTV